MRFWNDEVLSETEAVVARIATALPPPPPLYVAFMACSQTE
ncbi:MAG: hypothetical protein LC799_11625 [Actinobacteria bacterium]|nr:hypothetical protein [Actinomycetota bacterium]